MNVSELLRNARALVEQGWTQGAFARNASDEDVSPKDPTACKFCLYGAIIRAAHQSGLAHNRTLGAIHTAVNCISSDSSVLWDFNDSHTKEEVLALFDGAIEAADDRLGKE